MANSSYVALATNIFTAPREAFAALKERPRVLLPVVVLLIGFSAVSFYFLSHVDMGFFLDNQLRSGNANITDAQREQAVAAAAKIPPLVYGADRRGRARASSCSSSSSSSPPISRSFHSRGATA